MSSQTVLKYGYKRIPTRLSVCLGETQISTSNVYPYLFDRGKKQAIEREEENTSSHVWRNYFVEHSCYNAFVCEIRAYIAFVYTRLSELSTSV